MRRINSWIIVTVTCLFLLLFLKAYSYSEEYSKKYDFYYYLYSKKIFGKDFDWKRFKAQGLTESGLNPKAISCKGAKGLQQFMPQTWKYQEQKLKTKGDPFDPETNIYFSIDYMSWFYFKQWKNKRSEQDRFNLSLAAYNCGMLYLINSQKICYKFQCECNSWKSIAKYAHFVEKWDYKQTTEYVKKNNFYYNKLINE